MTFLESIILGIIQGLSEFIPISSTAHLTLAGHFMHLIDETQPEKWTAFIATIQLGTLLAVCVYYAKEIGRIITAFFHENFFGSGRTSFRSQSTDSRMGWFVIAGSLPIATIGLLLKHLIEGSFTKSPTVIGISLIALALIMAVAEKCGKFRREKKDLTLVDAVVVGLAQCIALIPGSSRSGTTISAGMFLGLRRDTAAEFSFLLSIPAIFASGLLEFVDCLSYLVPGEFMTLLIATLVSAISGYAAIAFLMKYLRNNTTFLFIIYRIIVGIAVLIYLA